MPLQNWNQLVEEAGDIEDNILPAADYDLEVVKAEAKQASTGRLMYKTQYRVISGPYKGRLLFDQLVLSTDNPNALQMFFRKMAAIGISKQYFAANPSDAQVAEALVGCKFRGQVGVRKWNGEDRNEVKSYARVAVTQGAGPQGAPPAMAPTPSPISSPPAMSSPAPAPAPQLPPPAAATAPPQPAPASTPAPAPAPAPITQAPVPPVIDDAPAPVTDAADVPATVPAAPADPF